MTAKNDRILQLRDTQKRKLEQNKKVTKRMWKHLLWITLGLFTCVLYYIDYSHVMFGSVKNFLMIAAGTFLLIFAIYFLLTRYKKKKNLKDIKTINGELYKLMKL